MRNMSQKYWYILMDCEESRIAFYLIVVKKVTRLICFLVIDNKDDIFQLNEEDVKDEI